MHKLDSNSPHLEDVTLWAWQRAELEGAPALAVQEHLATCSTCRQRADQILQLLSAMRASHYAVQPSLAQQMHLTRALHAHAAPAAGHDVWVKVSERLVRWLAPAVAVLALLFILTRESSTQTSSDVLTEFTAETLEAALLSARSDEEMQNAILELMFNSDNSQR
ncbi:MAG: zf-HC2 domain-containing protein [bacterium]